MAHFVEGFAFDADMRHVALIQKRRGPPTILGKWIGIGGLVERDEPPRRAMAREFQEEVTVDAESLRASDITLPLFRTSAELFWHPFASLHTVRGDLLDVYLAREADDYPFPGYRARGDEEVLVFEVRDILTGAIETALETPWMVAMALAAIRGGPVPGSGTIHRVFQQAWR